MRRLLVLRPEPGATETVHRARARGLDAFAVPLFEIEPLAWRVPETGAFDAILLTSANAVRHGGEQLQAVRGLPVYAVGRATADAAIQVGFDVAAVGDAGVDHLLSSIDPTLKLLHLCGEDRREPKDPRQHISALAVYRAKALDSPDLSTADATVAMIHSPRAARRLAGLVRNRGSIAIAAISEAAAEAAGDGWLLVETPEQPTDDALLALAARLCNNPAPE
jgi:uroporphyrinogen-III synthase